MECDEVGQPTGGLGSLECDASSVTASREECKELCGRTHGCAGFSYVVEDGKCHLKDDSSSDEQEDCDGTEAWENWCPYTTTTTSTTTTTTTVTTTTVTTTTTTVHDCWNYTEGSSFKSGSEMECDEVGQPTGGLGSLECDASSVTASREECKELCGRTHGCAGFSYVVEDG